MNDPTYYEADNSQATPHEDAPLQNERSASRTLLRIGLALTVFALLPPLLSFGLAKLVFAIAPDLFGTELYIYGQQILILYIITMPLCALIIGKPRTHAPLSVTAAPPKERRSVAMLIFFCIAEFFAIAGNLIGMILMNTVGIFRGAVPENGVGDLLQGSSPLAVLLVVVLIGPVMEELLFRYIITRRLLPYGEKTAVLLSGLFFGLAHGNFYQFFYCFAIGALFSFIYVRTKSLLYPIILHILFNFIGGFLPTLLTGMLPLDLSDPSHIEPILLNPAAYALPLLLFCLYTLLVYAAAIAGLVLFCIFFPRVRFSEPDLPIPRARRFPVLFLNVGMILFLLASLAVFALSLFS